MPTVLKILVVDDDEEIGMMMKIVLEYRGFEVIVLKRAEHTEKVLEDNKVALIVLDMLIAGVNGTDVCRELKRNSATADIPVLMITALPDAEMLCKEAGANDFLSKPFEIDLLISKINKLINV